jgi:hypothetical protein
MMSSTSVSSLELAADADTQGSPPSGTVLPWIDKSNMLDTFCYTIGTELSYIAGSTKTPEQHGLTIADEITRLEGTCTKIGTACTYTDLLDEYHDPTGVYAKHMLGGDTPLHQPNAEIIQEMHNITLNLKEHHNQVFHSHQPLASRKIHFPYKTTKKSDEIERDAERPNLPLETSVWAGLSLGRALAVTVGAVQDAVGAVKNARIWPTRQGRSADFRPFY